MRKMRKYLLVLDVCIFFIFDKLEIAFKCLKLQAE